VPDDSTTITPDVIQSLATKLDQVSDQFTDDERAALLAILAIASKAMNEAPAGAQPMQVSYVGGQPPLSDVLKQAFAPVGAAEARAAGMRSISTGGEGITWTEG